MDNRSWKTISEIKDRKSEKTFLDVPNPKCPFHIHVDSSIIGTGSILVQEFPGGKRLVSINSQAFTKDEQKLSNLHRELRGIISALQSSEHFILGSPHPIEIFCNQKPLLNLWSQKKRLFHQFFRYQVIITQSTNLQIIWTPGKNLAFPDMLIRNVSLKDLNGHQLSQKKFPRILDFSTKPDVKCNIWLTTTAPLMMEMAISIPLFKHIWSKQRNFTLKKIVLTWFVQFSTRSHLKFFNVSDSFRESKDFNNRRKRASSTVGCGSRNSWKLLLWSWNQ